MRILRQYQGLPPPVYALFGAQVINRFGDFVAPFLSFFITTQLGYGAQTAGLIMTVNALVGIPAMLIGGKAADHMPKKQAYILFQVLAAMVTLCCLVPFSAEIIVVLLLIKSAFAGMTRPAIMALLIDCLPPDKRQVGFSLNYLGINLGVAVGPLFAGILFNKSLPLIFIGDAVTSLLGVYIVWRYISEKKADRTVYELPEMEQHDNDHWVRALGKRPAILSFLGILILFNVVYVQCMFALPLYLSDLFGDKGPVFFGLLMSTNAITVLVATPFLTHWTRRRAPTDGIVMCGLLYAVGFGVTGYLELLLPLLVATVIWTLGEVLISTNSGVYLAALSPVNYRARFSALSGIAFAVGGALGTWLAGWYLQNCTQKTLWIWIALLSLIASLCMHYLGKMKAVTMESAEE